MTGKVLLPEGKLYSLKPAYAEAVLRAGGEPRVVRWSDPRPDARDFDALLLCGGVDIAPDYFGEALLENSNVEIDAERDEFEFFIIKKFIELKKPIYGICRGIQLINVAFGGSLWQDMPSQCGLVHSSPDKDKTLWHDVLMTDGRVLSVNSYHHQGVKKLGNGLVCLGSAPDGTVEAIRHNELPVSAVQWHPERMGDSAFALLDEFNQEA